MDIDLLSKMVKELLLDNDMVVLPGLGAFVAEVVPAEFTDNGYTINPPYRKLYFRSKPDEGNALAAFYAASNGVGVDVADRIIRDFIGELRTVLLIRKSVAFPGLGRLRATKENDVFFVADENLDIYPEGYGLAPVSLKTHQDAKDGLIEIVPVVETPVVPESQTVAPVIPEPQIPAQVVPEPQPVAPVVPEPQIQVPCVPEPQAVAPVKKEKRFWKIFFKSLLWTVVAAVVFLALYIIVARVCPDLLDKILYTPEELEILNS